MSRRIDIELTSTRDDGSWTWRAAGAREPRGTLEAAMLPSGAAVGSVVRAEVEEALDGLSIVAVLPPRAQRAEPERLELKSTRAEQPLVTSTLVPGRSGDRGDRGDRGGRRGERGRDGRDRREGGDGRRERRPGRDRERDRDRDRPAARHERPSRPAPPPVDTKPKPKRLRPGKTYRTALLEAVPAEQRPIAEQLLAGGIPSVRQAIDKQNAELRSEGKPEVKPDALMRVAEELRPAALAAVWRDRAEAAAAVIDELDLRDLRSVVNAAGDAGRDDDAKALASQLREALTARVEKEQAAWLAELAETVDAGRVVRALRLSSRPPKAGAPIPGDVATKLAEATAASLTDETGPDRWATVLDALAYSPVRRRVVPQSLPAKLTPDLRATIARLASRLPEIAHIFDIEPDPAAERAARGPARRRPGDRKDSGRKDGGRKGEGGRKGGDGKGEGGDRARKPKAAKQPPAPGTAQPKADEATSPEADAPEVEAGATKADEVSAPKADEVATPEVEAATPKADEAATPEADEAAAPEADEAATPEADEAATPEADEAATPEAASEPKTDGVDAPEAGTAAPKADEAAAPEADASPAQPEPAASAATDAPEPAPTVDADAPAPAANGTEERVEAGATNGSTAADNGPQSDAAEAQAQS